MSEVEIEKGKKRFIEIVQQHSPSVRVNISGSSQGRHKVLFIGRRSTSRVIDEDDFADLGSNGGRLADVTGRIKEALQEIGELNRP